MNHSMAIYWVFKPIPDSDQYSWTIHFKQAISRHLTYQTALHDH